MEGCLAGPALLVTRTNIWGGGSQADVPEVADQHLVGGKPVEMLRKFGPEEFCAQPRAEFNPWYYNQRRRAPT
jgi:(2Fe-2S) ferredoxin